MSLLNKKGASGMGETAAQETVIQEQEITRGETDLPTFLHQESLRLVIFGGKGGVGKTTSAAATATYLAQFHPGKRVVIASSDPAHSLSDSFDCPVGSSITPVMGMENLSAIEIDPPSLLKKFRNEYKAAIQTLNDMSFSTDQADVRDFLSLKLPGMADMMVLLEITDLLKVATFRPHRYDLVILDTAPTGHTLRLLSLTEKVLEWIELFQMSYNRHRRYAGGLAGLGMFKMRRNPNRPRPGNVKEFLDTLSENLTKIHDILENPEKCEFIPVAIPEEMGIAETERLFLELRNRDIVVRNIIVNRVQSKNQCVFCSSRREEQEKYLEEINRKFAAYNLIEVPVFPHEVRAKNSLLQYANALMGEYPQSFPSEAAGPETVSYASDSIQEMLDADLRFIIFSGKGGVGKTTVSAATALHLAQNNPDKKVLVISLDPAHSLSDSLALPIGDQVTRIRNGDNLHALEIDGAEIYEDFKREYTETIEEAFRTLKESGKYIGGRVDKLVFDRRVMLQFVDFYPPGIEDVLAMEQIIDVVEKKEYDMVILDTAPTGHLLKLLENPELVREWMKISSEAMLKYAREIELDNLDKLSKRILNAHIITHKMQKLLTDAKRSAFVAVTIAEEMSILETDDLLDSIRRLGMETYSVVVNMIIPPTTECNICTPKRKEQLGHVQQIGSKKELFGYGMTLVPLFPHEVRGIERLAEVSKIMFNGRQS